nr:hypothetical protein BaRGS_008630 [Batillaria attramentaria]
MKKVRRHTLSILLSLFMSFDLPDQECKEDPKRERGLNRHTKDATDSQQAGNSSVLPATFRRFVGIEIRLKKLVRVAQNARAADQLLLRLVMVMTD